MSNIEVKKEFICLSQFPTDPAGCVEGCVFSAEPCTDKSCNCVGVIVGECVPNMPNEFGVYYIRFRDNKLL